MHQSDVLQRSVVWKCYVERIRRKYNSHPRKTAEKSMLIYLQELKKEKQEAANTRLQ